ncbi:MAG: hypothetical protein PF489_00255 [Salinivirgaceae bacterium]|jgi:hypothetical protein|nr:hypothetical protein [Salinivirgaceae bacterium]
MKKNAALFLIFLFLVLNALGQRARTYGTNSDSLLALFQSQHAFDVLEKMWLYDVDIKDCYYNEELIPHVMKWLDKEMYFKYRNRGAYESFTSNVKYVKSRVGHWIEDNSKKVKIDSVLGDSVLLYQYWDTIWQESYNLEKLQYYKNGAKLPPKALRFHQQLKRPESYRKIYSFWKKDDFSLKSQHFHTMLTMHDPKAQGLFKKRFDSLLAAKKIDCNAVKVAGSGYHYGVFALSLAKKLFRYQYLVCNPVYIGFEEKEYPLNLAMFAKGSGYFSLLEDTTIKRLRRETALNRPESPEEAMVYSNTLIKILDELDKALDQHAKYLEEKDRYWEENMEYIKEE